MKEEREREGERKRETEGEEERETERERERKREEERERCSLCRFRMTNRDWYLHVKSSTKYRYVRYKISDLSVRYSMFRHLHQIAHLSDVICAIPGCTHFLCYLHSDGRFIIKVFRIQIKKNFSQS